MSTGGDFWGARPIEVKVTQALTLSARVHTVVGSTVTQLTRPAGRSAFVFTVTAGGFRIVPGLRNGQIFIDASVSVADDEIMLTGDHGWTSGAGPFQFNTSGTLPTGLNLLQDYWVNVIDSDTVTVHNTHKDAQKGVNRVDITAASGGGAHGLGVMPSGNPSSTNTNGIESTDFLASAQTNLVNVITGPAFVTVRGLDAGSNMRYWWLP